MLFPCWSCFYRVVRHEKGYLGSQNLSTHGSRSSPILGCSTDTELRLRRPTHVVGNTNGKILPPLQREMNYEKWKHKFFLLLPIWPALMSGPWSNLHAVSARGLFPQPACFCFWVMMFRHHASKALRSALVQHMKAKYNSFLIIKWGDGFKKFKRKGLDSALIFLV